MNYPQALRILELANPPSPQEVKSSFRKLALRYHPDRNPNNPTATTRFRECAEAYNYLVQHDHEWYQPERETQSPAQGPAIIDLADIFDDIFGFTREGRILGFQEPEEIILSLVELAHGVSKKGKFGAYKKCHGCGGTGAYQHSPATICTYCFGSGRIKRSYGFDEENKICPKCEGRGRHIRKTCPPCNGHGRIRIRRRQEVSIPPGFKPGEVYTVHSRDLNTNEIYDLFVRIGIPAWEGIHIENENVLCEYPLSQKLAQQGGVIGFFWLWGNIQATIPCPMPGGHRVVLKGCGLPSEPCRNKKGDLILSFRLLPEKEARRALKRFHKNLSSALRPIKESWFKYLLFGDE